MKKVKIASIALWVVIAGLFMAAAWFWMTMPTAGFGQVGRVIQQHQRIEFCLAAALLLAVLNQLPLSAMRKWLVGLAYATPHAVHLALHGAGWHDHNEMLWTSGTLLWDGLVTAVTVYWLYAKALWRMVLSRLRRR
jgi:hypothetical protein